MLLCRVLFVFIFPPQISWIDRDGLAQYIAHCQDDDGGIADAPGNLGDIFHTFFGICGLSLMSYFDASVPEYASFRRVDPTYALPVDIVEKLGLPVHKLPDVELATTRSK
jgi:geranylgeranyl transferase type-2 subunit beta